VSRPYSGCYDSLRTSTADAAAMLALDGDLEGYAALARCPCCGCWLGFGDKEWCSDCQYGDDREWN
jgi:hypothetical protein